MIRFECPQRSFIGLLALVTLLFTLAPSAEAKNCSPKAKAKERALLLATPTKMNERVMIKCSHRLSSQDRIQKRLVFKGKKASGLTLSCNGAQIDGRKWIKSGSDTLVIRSRKLVSSWEAPEDITIKDCHIFGSIRIWGMAKNGEGSELRESSRKTGHLKRTREAAPSNILLSNLKVVGHGRTPLYIAPGVHRVTLENSDIGGVATSVGIYLDTESGHNIIRGNKLHVTSLKTYVLGIIKRRREEIAIDNSNNNHIYNNVLSTLEGGGIYLYRNCGEGGTVRHGTPSNNQIINNIFVYTEDRGTKPAIYLGSRDNTIWEGRFYCHRDRGHPWGSSRSNRSYAHLNAVVQNRILIRPINKVLRQGDRSNRPNFVTGNRGELKSAKSRKSVCYLRDGYDERVIAHGASSRLIQKDNPSKQAPALLSCNDGRLKPH